MTELPVSFFFFTVVTFGNLDHKRNNIRLLTLLKYTEPMISKLEQLYYTLFKLVTKCFQRFSNIGFLSKKCKCV